MKITCILIMGLTIIAKGVTAQDNKVPKADLAHNKQVEQIANSQEYQSKLVLSLNDAKEYALKYNREVQNAGLAIAEANSKVWETLASGLPQVNATMDYKNYLGGEMSIQFDPNMPAQAVPFNSTSNLNVNVSQLLFSGTYIVGLQSAKLYKSLTEKSAQKNELQVKEQVSNAYFIILVSERSKEILNRNLQNVQDLYRNTEAMYKAGVAEMTDVDQLSIQVTMLKNTLRQTERQVDMAYDLLKLQLGVAPETGIELSQSLDEFLQMFDFQGSLTKTFELQNNIDYQLMESQEMMTKKQVLLRKMEYMPTLSANYVRTEKIISANFDMQPNNILLLNLNVPIFSSGMRKSKVKQAKIQLETTRNNMAQLEDALVIQERQARLNLNTALEQYLSQKENVEVANRVFQNINRKFQNGLVSSLDLTTANNNYLNAESAYIQSMQKVLEAHTTLEKLYSNL